MKNFKKVIILSIIIIIILVSIIYNYVRGEEEIIDEEAYVAVNTENEEINKIILHIVGEVNKPGIIQIDEGSRLADAIEAAGGATEYADIDKINLAYVVQDGQKINIPNVNNVEIESYISQEIGENIIVEDVKASANLVNINTATQAELETLTGIGQSTALKIINYRKENGKFEKIEDIKNVSGIGEAKYEAIKNEICV